MTAATVVIDSTRESKSPSFPGDRRVYSIDRPVGSDGAMTTVNRRALVLGARIRLPHHVLCAFEISAQADFVLREIQHMPSGPMGFCEMADSPGAGLWVKLAYLVPLSENGAPMLKPHAEQAPCEGAMVFDLNALLVGENPRR